jgi:outer membrane immunogenic protein
MRKLLLGTMALIGLLSAGAAQAADMPLKAAPVASPPPFSWSGFYIGAHVGAGWGTVESEIPLDPGAFPVSSHTINGFLGGGQAGWNWQVNPWLVLGFEGQFSGADIKGDTPCVIVFNCHTKVNWVASAAGRLGFAYNQTLFYVKGGGAWADSHYSADFLSLGVATFTANTTRSGWMVGAGIEQAFWTNWSAKLEYNFMDFGTDNIGFAFNNSCIDRVKRVVTDGSCTLPVDVTQKIHLIKFGLNYRFNWGAPAAPVAARY